MNNVISNNAMGNINTTENNVTNPEEGVMIVDDSKFSRKILSEILISEGFTIVAEAKNGLEAIEMAKEKKPKYVFLDVQMPVLDGLGALPKILEVHPETNVIMCTAMGQQNIILEAAKAGAKDYVLKPFKSENIISVMNAIMISEYKDGHVIPFNKKRREMEKAAGIGFQGPEPATEHHTGLPEVEEKQPEVQEDKVEEEVIQEEVIQEEAIQEEVIQEEAIKEAQIEEIPEETTTKENGQVEEAVEQAVSEGEEQFKTAQDETALKEEEQLEAVQEETASKEKEQFEAAQGEMVSKEEEQLEAVQEEMASKEEEQLEAVQEEIISEVKKQLEPVQEELVQEENEPETILAPSTEYLVEFLETEEPQIEKIQEEITPHEELIQEEINQEEVVQEEIVQEEIVQEEIVQEEIVQEEVVQEEIVREEIVQEEIVQEEVIQEEMIQEEVAQEEVVQEEVVQEKVIQEKVVEEEADREEVAEEAVIQEEAVSEEERIEAASEGGEQSDVVQEVTDQEVAVQEVTAQEERSLNSNPYNYLWENRFESSQRQDKLPGPVHQRISSYSMLHPSDASDIDNALNNEIMVGLVGAYLGFCKRLQIEYQYPDSTGSDKPAVMRLSVRNIIPLKSKSTITMSELLRLTGRKGQNGAGNLSKAIELLVQGKRNRILA